MKIIDIDIKNSPDSFLVEEDTEFRSTFVGQKDDDVKREIRFIHKAPGLKSRINIKAVMYENSRFDFQGMLRIEKGAIGSDTFLKIECLIIGENAYARAIPGLEILESEVKGGHSATVGYLDENNLYYLKSRGLNSKICEEELIKAFLNK